MSLSDLIDLLKSFSSSFLQYACPGAFGCLGTIAGGFVSLFGTLLVLCNQRKKWEHQQEVERQQWERDRAFETYAQAFWHVSHANTLSYVVEDKPEDIPSEDYKRLEFESRQADDRINRARHKWFNLLLVNYPNRRSKAYRALLSKVRDDKKKVEYVDILNLALEDPRLEDGIEPLLALAHDDQDR